MALSDLLSSAGANTTHGQILIMLGAAITALGDALSFASWLRGNATEDQEEIIYQLSEEITQLQEMLAGRIRLVNFGRDPSPAEAAAIYKRVAIERGETEPVARVGAEAVRHAMATGVSLEHAISAGTESMQLERRR